MHCYKKFNFCWLFKIRLCFSFRLILYWWQNLCKPKLLTACPSWKILFPDSVQFYFILILASPSFHNTMQLPLTNISIEFYRVIIKKPSVDSSDFSIIFDLCKILEQCISVQEHYQFSGIYWFLWDLPTVDNLICKI